MTHDKTMTRIARSTALPASLLGGLLATATLSAEMDRATWSDEDNYLLMMSHMPDFDQRRGGQNGLWTNQTVGGGTHCGPTSCANLLAYIATHGFPQVDPGSADYAQTGSQAIYDRATELIRDLGVEMNVDTWVQPNGTRGRGTTMNGQRNAMQARLSSQLALSIFS